MGAGRDVIHRHRDRDFADPPQGHGSFTVLSRLARVRRPEDHLALPIRARDGCELLDHDVEGIRRIEVACDHEDRIVRLVVLPVEGLETFDRHVLHVSTSADGRVRVVVPEIPGRENAPEKDSQRVVLSGLHLVSDDRHLGLEVFGRDERVDHSVRLEVQRPLEVVLRCREHLEVVGSIGSGGAVRLCPALAQLLRDIGVVRRPLKEQVLQEVGHPGLSVRLVTGAHEIRDVHRDARLTRIREEQNPQPVVQPVFGDALHAGDRREVGRRRLRLEARVRGERHGEGERGERQ